MNMKKITVVAKKTFIHSDGTESFTKGVEYKTEKKQYQFTEDTALINNQGQPHLVPDPWFKHFKVVK